MRASRHAICLILALLAALLLGPNPASAQPPDITPPDPTSGADPLDPSSDFPVALNAEIAAFKQRVAAWQALGQTLATRAQSLRSRIAAHNAVVDSFPGRTAPPAVAGPINAEAAALNAERATLMAEIDAWKAQAGGLEAEHLRLVQRMAYILQNQYKITPQLPFFKKPTGGDSSRPLGRNNRGEYSKDNGGDSLSKQKENAALDAYARDNGVQVIKNQTKVNLTPETYSKLSPADAAKLKPTGRYFDGLIRKPNGHYKALEIKTGSGKYDAGQRAFDDAIRNGGQATATLDRQEIIIDEVELVPG
jgi:hypothetical protein